MSLSTPLPMLSGNRLQLWPIIREAFAFPWQYRHALWKWVVVCGVLMGLTNFAAEALYTPDNEAEKGLLGLLYDFVIIVTLGALNIMLYTVFCIRCHRLLLLGPATEDDVFPPHFGEREYNFFSFLFIIYAGIAIVILPGFVIALILSSLLGISDTWHEEWILLPLFEIPLAYLLGRYCMVFPAAAVDLQPSLTWAWEQSKDVAWRLGISAMVSFLHLSWRYLIRIQSASISLFDFRGTVEFRIYDHRGSRVINCLSGFVRIWESTKSITSSAYKQTN